MYEVWGVMKFEELYDFYDKFYLGLSRHTLGTNLKKNSILSYIKA